MTPMTRGFILLVLASSLGGLTLALVYGVGDGLLTALFMLASGAPAIAGAHLLARRRAVAGPLSRQFAAGVGVIVALVALGVSAVALLMFLSSHDALLMVLLLVFAGGLIAYSASVLASGLMRDIESVRDGVLAVGEGSRDIEIATEANDEMSELADAANRMAGRLAASEADQELSLIHI